MSSRFVLAALLITSHLMLGGSVAQAQQPGDQDKWKDVVAFVDSVQLFIIRFSPVLMAAAIVAIYGALGSIKTAIHSLESSVHKLSASIDRGVEKSQSKLK
jgi:hypothetical protein